MGDEVCGIQKIIIVETAEWIDQFKQVTSCSCSFCHVPFIPISGMTCFDLKYLVGVLSIFLHSNTHTKHFLKITTSFISYSSTLLSWSSFFFFAHPTIMTQRGGYRLNSFINRDRSYYPRCNYSVIS